MSPAHLKELSDIWPRTVFHANGVATTLATSDEHFEKLLSQGWCETQQEPPPPPETFTPEEREANILSELTGLGDQVDGHVQILSTIESRLSKMEADSHPKVDFSPLFDSVNARLDKNDVALADFTAVLNMIMERLNALEAKKGTKS